MNLNCTICGIPVEDGQSVIAGIEIDGRLHFRWACQHRPAENAAVVLASNICCVKWVHRHPEYDEDISLLLAAADKSPKHPGCDKDVSNGVN